MVGDEYEFVEVEDTPDFPEKGVVYVVGAINKWCAVLVCHCGCGETIHLNLLEDQSPKWKVYGNNIAPSINRTKGCRSHFNIKGGKVE